MQEFVTVMQTRDEGFALLSSCDWVLIRSASTAKTCFQVQLLCLIKFPKKGAKRLFVALIKTYYFQLYFFNNHKLYVAHDSLSASVISSRFAKKEKRNVRLNRKQLWYSMFVKIARIALENSFDTTAPLLKNKLFELQWTSKLWLSKVNFKVKRGMRKGGGGGHVNTTKTHRNT